MSLHRPCSLCGLLLFAVVGCSSPTVLSGGDLTSAPSIDASLSEWGTRLTLVEEGVSMAAHPTDSLLYVAVLIRGSDRIRAIAQHGLIVWVDPANEQRRTYGVQYPIGRRRLSSGPARQRGTLDAVSLDRLEVVRGDTSRRRIPARFSSGLRGEIALEPASLISELAVPVNGTSKHGLSASLETPTGLGLEIPRPDDEAVPEFDTEPSVTERGGGSLQDRREQPPQEPKPEPQPARPTLDVWVTLDVSRP